MQAKDVPDRPVLELLARNPERWHFRFPLTGGSGDEWLVARAMPPDTPEKIILAKMRALMRRGLVDGCGCGCRGDFVITPKGQTWLSGLPPEGEPR